MKGTIKGSMKGSMKGQWFRLWETLTPFKKALDESKGVDMKRLEDGDYLDAIDPVLHLRLHREAVERLKVAWSDQKTWGPYIEPALLKLSAVVQRLPLTADGVFSDVDGLFLASILSATYAIEVMEGTVQLERNIMAQELLQTRLKGAVLMATLCAYLRVLVADLEIGWAKPKTHPFFEMDEAHFVENLSFNPLGDTLYAWLARKDGEAQEGKSVVESPKRVLRWKSVKEMPRHMASHNIELFLARNILPEATMVWLSEAGMEPLLELMRALTVNNLPDFEPSSVIYARDLGVYRACQLERERMGAKLGRLLAPYGWEAVLVRVLRARIWRDWPVNAKDSPLRRGGDGLFLFWPDVCALLIDDMKGMGLKDLPTDPNLWAGLLMEVGITEASRRGTATCMIAVTPNAKPREAVKLADAEYFEMGRGEAKKAKRAFECEDLTLAQEVGVQRLTREVMEASLKAYEMRLPRRVEAPDRIDWRFDVKSTMKDVREKLEALAELLSAKGESIRDFVLDEGLLLSRELLVCDEGSIGVPATEAIGDYGLFIAGLTTQGFLFQNEKGSVLYVKSPVKGGVSYEEAPILKPTVMTIAFIDEKGLKEPISYDRLFEHVKGRARKSFKKDEEGLQVELFAEGDA